MAWYNPWSWSKPSQPQPASAPTSSAPIQVQPGVSWNIGTGEIILTPTSPSQEGKKVVIPPSGSSGSSGGGATMTPQQQWAIIKGEDVGEVLSTPSPTTITPSSAEPKTLAQQRASEAKLSTTESINLYKQEYEKAAGWKKISLGLGAVGINLGGVFGYGLYSTSTGTTYGGREQMYSSMNYPGQIATIGTGLILGAPTLLLPGLLHEKKQVEEVWKMKGSAIQQEQLIQEQQNTIENFNKEITTQQDIINKQFGSKIIEGEFAGTPEEYSQYQVEFGKLKGIESKWQTRFEELKIETGTIPGKEGKYYLTAPAPMTIGEEVALEGTKGEYALALTTIAAGKFVETYVTAGLIGGVLPAQLGIKTWQAASLKTVGGGLVGLYVGGEVIKGVEEYKIAGWKGVGLVGAEVAGTAYGFATAMGKQPIKIQEIKAGETPIETSLTVFEKPVVSYSKLGGIQFGYPKGFEIPVSAYGGTFELPSSKFQIEFAKRYLQPQLTSQELQYQQFAMQIQTSTYGTKVPASYGYKQFSEVQGFGGNKLASENIYSWTRSQYLQSPEYVYGSTSSRTFMGEQYRIPHDIDKVFLDTMAKTKAIEAGNILKLSGGSKVIVQQGQVGMAGTKVLDIHGLDTPITQQIPANVYGFKWQLPIRVENIPTMPLTQSATQKTAAILTYQISPTGQVYLAPALKTSPEYAASLKHIGDFYSQQKFLAESAGKTETLRALESWKSVATKMYGPGVFETTGANAPILISAAPSPSPFLIPISPVAREVFFPPSISSKVNVATYSAFMPYKASTSPSPSMSGFSSAYSISSFVSPSPSISSYSPSSYSPSYFLSSYSPSSPSSYSPSYSPSSYSPSYSPSSYSPYSPLTFVPFTIPPIFPSIGWGELLGKGLKTKRNYKYQPSIGAILTGFKMPKITAGIKFRELTGFMGRPIISGYGRKRKSNSKKKK